MPTIADQQPYQVGEEVSLVGSKGSALPIQRGTSSGKLILYYPLNPLREDGDSQSQIVELLSAIKFTPASTFTLLGCQATNRALFIEVKYVALFTEFVLRISPGRLVRARQPQFRAPLLFNFELHGRQDLGLPIQSRIEFGTQLRQKHARPY